jgi:phosphate/sulfate permease
MGLIKYIFKETDSTLNNTVKALLMGFIFGLLAFLIMHTGSTEERLIGGIIVFIVASGGLFLRYNNKKK